MRTQPSAIFFWTAAVLVGSLDVMWFPAAAAPCTQSGGRGCPLTGVVVSAKHTRLLERTIMDDEVSRVLRQPASRRAWQTGSTLDTSTCSSEPWIINTSDLTVTAGYLQLLSTCPGSLSGTEAVSPTAQLLVNATLRIAPGTLGSNTQLCVNKASLASRELSVTGVNRAYTGSNQDDLRVVPEVGTTTLCQSGSLMVSGLKNIFTNVLIRDNSRVLSTERYRGIGTAVIGKKVIFAGGYIHGGAYSATVDIYDTTSFTWTTSTLSGGGRMGVAGAGLRHIAMFFGGSISDTTVSKVVDIYNNSNNAWTTYSLASGDERAFGSATGVGDVIIWAGGHRGDTFLTPMDNVNIYNIVTGVWTKTTLSQARHGMAAVTVGSMALFAGGAYRSGCDRNCKVNNVQSNRVDLYNSNTHAWSTANLSQARSYLAGTAHGTKAFFAGGDISQSATDDPAESSRVDIYDSATGVWTNIDFPDSSRRRTLLGAAASGRAVIFLGGCERDRTGSSNLIDIYEVDEGVWVTSTTTSTGRYWMASATVGDFAIFAGGMDTSDRNTVDILQYKTQVQVYAIVNASSRLGSMNGRFQLPMTVTPIRARISLPTASDEVTNHNQADTWKIQCNTTVNGKLDQTFILGATDPVCIASNGLCPIGKYSSGNGVSYNITDCFKCPALTTTASEGNTRITGCKCNRGYTGPDAGTCTACTAGTYKDFIGSSGCSLCAAAKYSAIVGADNISLCLACPSDSSSPSGSTLQSQCICNRGYTGPDGGSCVGCVAGKYKPTNGSVTCMQCTSGKFSAATGATSNVCADCSANTYSSTNNNQCIDCPSNTVSVRSSYRITDCLCNLGYTGPDGGTCVACVAGKYKAANSSGDCTQCAAGKYSAVTGATSNVCADCSANTYSSTNNSQCIDCPSNAVSAKSSYRITDCLCNLGYTGPDGGTCVACEVGKYKATNSSGNCTECAAGTYSASSAATNIGSCLACGVNTYSSAGSSQCVICQSNMFAASSSVVQTDCKCNVGYTGPDGGICIACVVGKFKPTNGTANCTDCAVGKYWDSEGAKSDVCVKCPNNSTAPSGSGNITDCQCDRGLTGIAHKNSCVGCQAGKFKSSSGSAECTNCSAGTYSVPAVTVCMQCPAGSTSLEGSPREGCECMFGFTGATTSTFRLVPVTFRSSAPTAYQVSEFRFFDSRGNKIDPTSATNPGGNNPVLEIPSKLIDNNIDSKFSDFNKQPVVFMFNSWVVVPGMSYEWVTGNDSLDRDMISWRLEGKQNATDTAWTTLHTVSNYATTVTRKAVVGRFYVDTVQACPACEAGKYKNVTGTAFCTWCPENATSLVAAPALTNCTCLSGHTGYDGTVCSACRAGDYKSVMGSAPCDNCPAGKISIRSSQTACLNCEDGKFPSLTRTVCTNCPADSFGINAVRIEDCKCNAGYSGLDGDTCLACGGGRYKNVSGSALCTWCAAGKYSGGLAVVSCQTCPDDSISPEGSFSNNSCNCNAGYSGLNGSSCNACVAGKFKSSTGSLPCTQCMAGKYSAIAASMCTNCMVNTYSSTNNSQCIACPSNTLSAISSYRITDCVCNLGYTGPDGGTCVACVAGKYKPTNGSSTCTQCATGKYFAATGATSDVCSDCSANTYSSTNTSQCIACPSNTLSAISSYRIIDCVCNLGYTGLDGGTCVACVAGKYKPTNGSVTCTQCAAGKYSAATGATSDVCSDCSANTYSSTNNSQCIACPSNTLSATSSYRIIDCACNMGYTGPDGGTCVECVAGKYKATNGSSPCTECAVGKYLTSSAATNVGSCLQCPSQSTSAASSVLSTDCKCNMGFTGPNGDICTACVQGKYKGVVGSAECTSCVAGTYSTTQGAENFSTCIGCPTGTYSESVGAALNSTCIACPNFSDAPARSSSVSNCSCNAGYTGPDGTSCTGCPAGRYKGVRGSSGCMLCEYHTYNEVVGASACLKCVEGAITSNVGSDSINLCGCSVGYTGNPPSILCQKCAVGKYKPKNGTSPCDWCSVDQYSDILGATICSSCPIHSTNFNKGRMSSLSFDEAKAQPGASVVESKHPYDNNMDQDKNISIQEATALYIAFDEQTRTEWSSDWVSLLKMDGAKVLTDTWGLEKYSGQNSFPGVGGNGPLLMNGTNSFTLRFHSDSEGTYWGWKAVVWAAEVASVLSDNRTDCRCLPGYSFDGGAPFMCKACGAGTWKPNDGFDPCTICQAGKYSTAIAATSETVCKTCPSNANSLAGSIIISQCTCNSGHTNPGGFWSDPPVTDCSKCSAGKYKPTQGTQECSLCGQGKYSERLGQINETTCIPCPRGSLSLAFGAVDNSTCKLCPAGTYMPGSGATSCVLCPDKSESLPGAYSIDECRCMPGNTGPSGRPCSPCAAGKYKLEFGNSQCLDCPLNAFSAPGSGRATSCVCEPGYTGMDETNGWACVLCKPGTYKPLRGTMPCTSCGVDSFSQPGSTSLEGCDCDEGYMPQGDLCVKCPPGKFKSQTGRQPCLFPVSSQATNTVIEAELSFSGMTKAEFISSQDTFKQKMAESILSKEESKGLDWSANNVILISVCMGTDCTLFSPENRTRRQSSGLTITYKITVPKGISAAAMAQTMSDPGTLKSFETKISDATGKSLSAKYNKPPSVLKEELVVTQEWIPWHKTSIGVLVLACGPLLLIGIMGLFRANLKKKESKKLSLPPHLTISLMCIPERENRDILQNDLGRDLSAALQMHCREKKDGLDHTRVIIVGVKKKLFFKKNVKLEGSIENVVQYHENNFQGSAGKAGTGDNGIATMQKRDLKECVIVHTVAIHLLNYGEAEVEDVVQELIIQSKNQSSMLMSGKRTMWTFQINNSNEDIWSEDEDFQDEQAGTPGRKKVASISWEMAQRLVRWTTRTRVHSKDLIQPPAEQQVESFTMPPQDRLAVLDIRPATASVGGRSSFRISGFDFNHIAREKQVFFYDTGPEVSEEQDQVFYAEKLRSLLREAENLTAGMNVDAQPFAKKHVHFEPADVNGQDLGSLARYCEVDADPEPFRKQYGHGILAINHSLTNVREVGDGDGSRQNEMKDIERGFKFFSRSSTIQREDLIRKTTGASLNDKVRFPFNGGKWEGLQKERNYRKSWREDEFVDDNKIEDEFDNLVNRMLSECPHTTSNALLTKSTAGGGLLVSTCPSGPSELQELLSLLENDTAPLFLSLSLSGKDGGSPNPFSRDAFAKNGAAPSSTTAGSGETDQDDLLVDSLLQEVECVQSTVLALPRIVLQDPAVRSALTSLNESAALASLVQAPDCGVTAAMAPAIAQIKDEMAAVANAVEPYTPLPYIPRAAMLSRPTVLDRTDHAIESYSPLPYRRLEARFPDVSTITEHDETEDSLTFELVCLSGNSNVDTDEKRSPSLPRPRPPSEQGPSPLPIPLASPWQGTPSGQYSRSSDEKEVHCQEEIFTEYDTGNQSPTFPGTKTVAHAASLRTEPSLQHDISEDELEPRLSKSVNPDHRPALHDKFGVIGEGSHSNLHHMDEDRQALSSAGFGMAALVLRPTSTASAHTKVSQGSTAVLAKEQQVGTLEQPKTPLKYALNLCPAICKEIDDFNTLSVPSSRPMTSLTEFGTAPSDCEGEVPSSARGRVRFKSEVTVCAVARKPLQHPGPLIRRLTNSRPATGESSTGKVMRPPTGSSSACQQPGPLIRRLTNSRPATSKSSTGEVTRPPTGELSASQVSQVNYRPRTQGNLAVDVGWEIVSPRVRTQTPSIDYIDFASKIRPPPPPSISLAE